MLVIGNAYYTLQACIWLGFLGYGIIWCFVVVVVATVSANTVDD